MLYHGSRFSVGKIRLSLGTAILAAAMVSGGCSTTPITSTGLEERTATAQCVAGASECNINADYVYYLPQTYIQITMPVAPGNAALTAVSVMDKDAGFVVEKSRRWGSAGKLFVHESYIHNGKLPDNLKASSGLIQTVSFSTAQQQDAASGDNINSSLNALVNPLRKQNEESANDDSKKLSAIDDKISNFTAVSVPELIQVKDEQPAPPEISFYCLPAEYASEEGCIKRTLDGNSLVMVWIPAAAAPAFAVSSRSCAEDSICYRRAQAVPVSYARIDKGSRSDQVAVNDNGCSRAKEVTIAGFTGCLTAQGTEMMQIMDRSLNYGMQIQGKSFVAVSTAASLNKGELVAFSDDRPSTVTSVAQVPYKLVTDAVTSAVTLVAFIFN